MKFEIIQSQINPHVPSPMDTIHKNEIAPFIKDNPDFMSIWFDQGSPYSDFTPNQRVAFVQGYIARKEET